MSEIDWKAEIVRLATIKQDIAAADQRNALPWALPNVAATEADLEQAERVIGRSLPNGYRTFLSYANGWTGFCVLTDLFGTKDLVSERAQTAQARPDLFAFCKSNNLNVADCLVIGESPNDLNLFVIFQDQPEAVVWICVEEVDRYEKFQDFFIAMIAYNEQVLKRLTRAS